MTSPRSFFATAFAFTVVAAIHCGGRVDANPDGGPCSAGDLCSTEGAHCTVDVTYCNQPTTETCTCESGQWACPVLQGNCPIEVCPVDTYPGDSCSTQGLQCQSMLKGCNDLPIMCTCDGAQFNCPIPDCPVQACPPPSAVVAGAPCNDPGNDVCSDSFGGSCKCMGTWQCADPIDAGPPPDAGWK